MVEWISFYILGVNPVVDAVSYENGVYAIIWSVSWLRLPGCSPKPTNGKDVCEDITDKLDALCAAARCQNRVSKDLLYIYVS